MNNMNQLYILVVFFLFLSCDKGESPIETDCDKVSEVNDRRFQNAPRDEFDFVSAEIIDDCLAINVRYGGGCGGAEFELIGSTTFGLSLPPQRSVVISFDDNDDCEAIVDTTISFDLRPLRIENTHEVGIILDGISRTPFSYIY